MQVSCFFNFWMDLLHICKSFQFVFLKRIIKIAAELKSY